MYWEGYFAAFFLSNFIFCKWYKPWLLFTPPPPHGFRFHKSNFLLATSIRINSWNLKFNMCTTKVIIFSPKPSPIPGVYTEHEWGVWGAEGEGKSQASSLEPNMGLHLTTLKSWPEPKSRVRPLTNHQGTLCVSSSINGVFLRVLCVYNLQMI